MSTEKLVASSLSLFQLGRLVYPIMLAQERGGIGEAKAAELLGLDIVTYREERERTIAAVMQMVESLPSPLTLLLGGTREKPKSSTRGSGS